MQIQAFKLERYFAKYEFQVEHLLSSSDCESLPIQDLLAMADASSLELWQQLSLGYTESKGHPLLREEIASLYPGLTADDVVVAVPAEAIFLGLNAILHQGDHVIITYPAYQSLYEIPRTLGCQVTNWPLELKDGKWALNLDFLENSITPNTKLLIINFPHNPTGYLPAGNELDKIIDIARRHNLYIFSDEMYRLSEYNPADRLEPVGGYYEKGISLSGLSKTFGLPGLRIGWLATGDKELMDKFSTLKDYTTICSSAPSEILSIIALRAKDALIRRNLQIIGDNLALAADFFSKHHDLFTWIPPQAGSVAFPELKTNLPVEKFCEDVVEKKNVMVLPGTVFDFQGNHFRVGLGRKGLPLALKRLGEYIAELGTVK